jgi:hypothetical protein
MDISDVRRLVEEFGTGAVTAEELREAFATSVAAAPHLAERYIALVCSFGRGAGIDDELRASLIAAIDEVASSGPATVEIRRRPVAAPSAGRGRDPGSEPQTRRVDAGPRVAGPQVTATPSQGPAATGAALERGPAARSASGRSWQESRAALEIGPAAAADSTPVAIPPRSSIPVAWLVAVGALAVAAVFVGPPLWERVQARRLATGIVNADASSFAGAYAELVAAPAPLRNRALEDERLRDSLVAHFRDESDGLTAQPALDFARARERLQELNRLLPGSSVVTDLVQRLEQSATVEVGRQLELRDRLLHQGALLGTPGGGDGVVTVLERIQRIDPSNSALRDPGTAAAFAVAARAALEGGHAEDARALIDAGFKFAVDDPRLLAIRERLAREPRQASTVQQADDIAERVAALDPAAADFLESALAHHDDLIALAASSAAPSLTKRLQAALESAVAIRLKQRLAADDVAGASELLLNVGDLLPETSVATLRESVLEGARAQEARTLDTLDKLRHSILTGRISQPANTGALALSAELQRAGASPDMLAEARDLIAYGYLRESRRARLAGDRQVATDELQKASELRPGTPTQAMIDAERQVLTGSVQLGASDLDAARGGFAVALHAPKLGQAEFAAIAQSLDHLESIGSSPKEVAAGLRQVEDRVLAELGRLRRESPDEAQLLARQASAALPASERLADAARQRPIPGTRGGAPPPDTGVARRELAAVVARPEPTERWAAELKRSVQKLVALADESDPAIVEARRVASTTFTAAAAHARSQRRYSEASNLLALARSIAPQGSAPANERPAIERTPVTRARSDSEPASSAQEQRANLDAVKQRLADQAAAGDVAGAAATANALRRVMAGSLYVQRDVPQALIGAYQRKARNEVAAGRVDAALQTLAEGRQKFGSSPELKSLELRYVVIGDAYDRLSTAINLNVAEQRRYLDKMRESEGAEFATVERMLAQTLANRIADQKAANRPTIAAGLLEAGRKVFPEHTSVLEQGRAGALPNTPIAINTEVRP